MKEKKIKRSRSAFSLLELLIVILIVSLSYVLVFTAYRKKEQAPKALTPMTLKSTLAEQGLLHSESELFCLDKCQSCYMYRDGESSEYEGKVALGNITAYRADANGNLEEIDFGRYQDHPVCLRYKLHSNGSTSQLLIESGGRFYFLPAFFGETLEVDSLDEAKTLWLRSTKLLTGGEYY